jgi:DNA (cytosine-5)-methyltransferase 1
MTEVAALPWNGYNAVSTFSGCGGSSLGYRMAGFRVRWASEFIPAAQDTYRANSAPYTVLDGRDIREVTGAELLAAAELDAGEIDLFDGSPPCSAFSMLGTRDKGWGVAKRYSDSEQRVDDLFFEFVRLIRETQPRTFVAENVAGLVKGNARAYFRMIMQAMKGAGYQVAARLLDASWLDVPQARQRLIFVGVREDLGLPPVHPKPLPYQRIVRDVLPIPGITDRPLTEDPETGADLMFIGRCLEPFWRELKPGQTHQKRYSLRRTSLDRPSFTLTTTSATPYVADVTHWSEPRKFCLAELRRLSGFPDDFALTGRHSQRGERIGRAVPPPMMARVAATIRDEILAPLREKGVI